MKTAIHNIIWVVGASAVLLLIASYSKTGSMSAGQAATPPAPSISSIPADQLELKNFSLRNAREAYAHYSQMALSAAKNIDPTRRGGNEYWKLQMSHYEAEARDAIRKVRELEAELGVSNDQSIEGIEEAEKKIKARHDAVEARVTEETGIPQK